MPQYLSSCVYHCMRVSTREKERERNDHVTKFSRGYVSRTTHMQAMRKDGGETRKDDVPYVYCFMSCGFWCCIAKEYQQNRKDMLLALY